LTAAGPGADGFRPGRPTPPSPAPCSWRSRCARSTPLGRATVCAVWGGVRLRSSLGAAVARARVMAARPAPIQVPLRARATAGALSPSAPRPPSALRPMCRSRIRQSNSSVP